MGSNSQSWTTSLFILYATSLYVLCIKTTWNARSRWQYNLELSQQLLQIPQPQFSLALNLRELRRLYLGRREILALGSRTLLSLQYSKGMAKLFLFILPWIYSDHLMQRADSLENTLMLGKTEGKREEGRRGWNGQTASLTKWTWIWANSRR